MALELLLERPVPTGTPARPELATLSCARTREILRDDLRPEPQLSVSGKEYAGFLWHMCWCPDCLRYERALDAPWVASTE